MTRLLSPPRGNIRGNTLSGGSFMVGNTISYDKVLEKIGQSGMGVF